jgi:iron complex transport system substrate-binding protein
VLAVLGVSVAASASGCSRKQGPSSAGGSARLEASATWSADPTCTFPHTARDQRGVDVTLAAPAHRILSLLPSHTETLFALGLGADVVGIDDYSADIPGAGALPHLGGLYDTHAEALLSLRPDLALVSETSPAAGALEHAGVPTWGGSAGTFDAIPVVISAIGALVCRSQEAARIVGQLADDTAAVEKVAAGRPRVRVYYELDASLYTVGPRSFVGTMIEKAGGEDIVPASLGDFPKISPEAVIAGNPEVIFGVTPRDAHARPGWDKIAAVSSGRVFKLSPQEGELVARPGPRIAEGLRVLLHRIHPEVVEGGT